jgi:hypothetical protein
LARAIGRHGTKLVNFLAEAWTNITAPQATIVSGFLTLLAAVFGVILGWWLFSGRVRDLKSAIDSSDKLLADHRSTVEQAIGEIRTKVGGLDALFTTALESLGQLRGNVSDLQSIASSQDEAAPPAAVGPVGNPEMLRDDWDAIRDALEQRAADPTVDGRRRAKYARIDRRRYLALINALDEDGALGDKAPDYREASNLWQRYRNGRRAPSADDSQRMSTLRNLITTGP